jgi:DNA-binding NarL/FixJ family response regulator
MTDDGVRLPRVVIADDHPIVLSAFRRMLNPCCEVVASVSTGTGAVDAVMALRPDFLVVDLMLEDLDGLKVCRQVKKISPDTDVIIVTAFADAQVEAMALEQGAAAFEPKQQAAATLVNTIQRVFASRHGRSKALE